MKKLDPSKCKVWYSTVPYFKYYGAFVTCLPEDINLPGAPIEDYFNTGDTGAKRGETVIVVSMSLAKHLTEEEMYALLCHECGHIVNGDKCDPVSPGTTTIEQEFSADDYAVTLVSKELLVKTLVKAIKYTREIMIEDLGSATAEMIFSEMQRIAVPRIDRLLS